MALIPYYLKEAHGGAPHGGDALPPLDDMLAFGRIVMICAAADGDLSPLEMDELLMMMVALGIPADMVDDLRSFDPREARLEDYVLPRYRPMARQFLYDAIKVARVDGYHEKERHAIRRFGAIMGVEENVVTAIEGLIEVEAALRNARVTLLRGGGG